MGRHRQPGDGKATGEAKAAVGIGAAIVVNIIPASVVARIGGLIIAVSGGEGDAAPANTVSASRAPLR